MAIQFFEYYLYYHGSISNSKKVHFCNKLTNLVWFYSKPRLTLSKIYYFQIRRYRSNISSMLSLFDVKFLLTIMNIKIRVLVSTLFYIGALFANILKLRVILLKLYDFRNTIKFLLNVVRRYWATNALMFVKLI